MKNGLVQINLFKLLDAVRSIYNVTDSDWALRSNLGHGVRISELRAMAEGKRKVPDRAFHIKKFTNLVNGLKSLLGEDIVKTELTKLLDKAETPEEKILLLMSILSDDRKAKVADYAALLAKVPEESKDTPENTKNE